MEFDDIVPGYVEGIISCGSVRCYHKNGNGCVDQKGMIDNAEYCTEAEMILAVSRRLKFPSSIISIAN